jgi:zinc D-Ala-D-Ala carboxypeptidase
MTTHFHNWRDVPADMWRWTNFSPREIACKGTGSILINEDALDKLQALRARLGKPLIMTSAYRSRSHNKTVSGAKNSLHMQGTAFDIRMDNHDPHDFEAAAREVGFTGFGYYPKSGFMHIDTGPERTWGTPWPRTATGWAPEPVRQPESLKEDKEVQAASGAALTGVAAVAIEQLPVASSLLGSLAPTAQLVAVVMAGLCLGYLIWKRTR